MAEMNDNASAVKVEPDDSINSWILKCPKSASRQFKDSPQLQDNATSKGFSLLATLMEYIYRAVLRIISTILMRFGDDYVASAIANSLLLSLHYFSHMLEEPVKGVLTGGIMAGHAASSAMSWYLSSGITPLFSWLRSQLCCKYLEWRVVYEHGDQLLTIWKWLAEAGKPKVVKQTLTKKDRDEIKKYITDQSELIMGDLLTLPITLVTGFIGATMGGFIGSVLGAAVGGFLGCIAGTGIAAFLTWAIKWRPKSFKNWIEKQISTNVNTWIEIKM